MFKRCFSGIASSFLMVLLRNCFAGASRVNKFDAVLIKFRCRERARMHNAIDKWYPMRMHAESQGPVQMDRISSK